MPDGHDPMIPPAAATSLACSVLINRGWLRVGVARFVCEIITGLVDASRTFLVTASVAWARSTHVRHRRKHRAADMAGAELGNRPFLESATEGASCRRLVRKLLEKKSPRVAVGIHRCMAVEERDAGGALLRIELHAEVCEPRRDIDG